MNKFKCVLLGILLVSFQMKGVAQSSFFQKVNSFKSSITKSVSKLTTKHKVASDSSVAKTVTPTPAPLADTVVVKKDTELVKKVKKVKEPKQVDSSYVKYDVKKAMVKFKNQFHKTWKKTLVDFTHNETYLLGGMNLSKQNVDVGDYHSNFNYDLTDYNKDAYKPGYFIGYRVDGKFKEKHNYSFSMSLNKIASGTNYQSTSTLSPFLGTFSKFKADEQFFTLSMAAHYRKLLVFGDTVKRKFYVVAGPSLDTRLSGQSADNMVNANYHRMILRGDIGLEFDNQSLYTFFVHYKQGLSSFTKTPIKTNLNTLEIGMMIKASDLF